VTDQPRFLAWATWDAVIPNPGHWPALTGDTAWPGLTFTLTSVHATWRQPAPGEPVALTLVTALAHTVRARDLSSYTLTLTGREEWLAPLLGSVLTRIRPMT
jgi:hypothetical protein